MTDSTSRVTDTTRTGEASAPGVTGPPFGRFSYDVATGKLVWTERTFRIFGFAPGDVVPTLELMSSHVHPDDRSRVDAAVARSLAEGETYCEWHRVVDTRQKVRNVLSVGYAAGRSAAGSGVLNGFVVDLTSSLRKHREQETTRAVIDAAATRDLIEQAKGMMMVIFDLTEPQAFDLLRWHSSHHNIKLREVAATLVDRLIDPQLSGMKPRERLTAILDGLRRPGTPVARPPLPGAVGSLQPAPAPAYRRGTTSAGRRISNADLPRTMLRAVSVAAVSITIADWLDPEQPLVYVNDAFAQLTGYSSDDILGRNCRFLQGPDSDQQAVKEMRQALDNGRDIRSVLRNYRKDGTPFWNEVHLSAVRDDSGRITHYIGYQSDVSERVEREEQLRVLAYRDAVTDLPNAAAGRADLETAVSSRPAGGFDLLRVRVDRDGGTAPEPAQQRATFERLHATIPAAACLSVQPDQSFLLRIPSGGYGTDDVVAAVRIALSEPEVVGGFPTGLRTDASVRINRVRYPADGADATSLLGALAGSPQE